ncbi:unnamed protein product [Soboliphyme baturini]|uniref:Coiled-coil domain-containing protein n=1 Tax=Soboliphyme baturini TaxID=241478 RepID=A0A183I8S9_9BILA|nr:unnamed protein product [Soboliphyme baturini]
MSMLQSTRSGVTDGRPTFHCGVYLPGNQFKPVEPQKAAARRVHFTIGSSSAVGFVPRQRSFGDSRVCAVQQLQEQDSLLSSAGSRTGMKCNQTTASKRVVPPKPLLDTYRYSMVNLEESADVDLDSLINELCALEVQLDDVSHLAIKSNGGPRSVTKGATSVDNRCSFTDHMDNSQVHDRRALYFIVIPCFHPPGDFQEIQLRSRSPDNDSAFCDTVSLLSDAGTATLKSKEESNGGSSVDSTRGSMTTPSPTQVLRVL